VQPCVSVLEQIRSGKPLDEILTGAILFSGPGGDDGPVRLAKDAAAAGGLSSEDDARHPVISALRAGRVALTPGCQIVYMDHTGWH
jgi:hypothetical protein